MPDGQHAWNRAGMWDAYFAVVLAATLLIVVSTSGPVAARTVAAISLAATVPLYLLVGRPAITAGRDTRRGTIYVICVIVLIVIAQTQDGASSWVMFAACPQCFMAMALPRALRRGGRAQRHARGGGGHVDPATTPARSRSCSAPSRSAWRSPWCSAPGSSRSLSRAGSAPS